MTGKDDASHAPEIFRQAANVLLREAGFPSYMARARLSGDKETLSIIMDSRRELETLLAQPRFDDEKFTDIGTKIIETLGGTPETITIPDRAQQVDVHAGVSGANFEKAITLAIPVNQLVTGCAQTIVREATWTEELGLALGRHRAANEDMNGYARERMLFIKAKDKKDSPACTEFYQRLRTEFEAILSERELDAEFRMYLLPAFTSDDQAAMGLDKKGCFHIHTEGMGEKMHAALWEAIERTHVHLGKAKQVISINQNEEALHACPDIDGDEGIVKKLGRILGHNKISTAKIMRNYGSADLIVTPDVRLTRNDLDALQGRMNAMLTEATKTQDEWQYRIGIDYEGKNAPPQKKPQAPAAKPRRVFSFLMPSRISPPPEAKAPDPAIEKFIVSMSKGYPLSANDEAQSGVPMYPPEIAEKWSKIDALAPTMSALGGVEKKPGGRGVAGDSTAPDEG